MKVRWRQGFAGRVHGQSVRRGEETEVPDEAGARYCELGYCEPVADVPDDDAEKAVPEADEETRGEKKSAAEEPASEKPKRRTTKSR